MRLAIFNLALPDTVCFEQAWSNLPYTALPEHSDLTCNTLLIPVLSRDSRDDKLHQTQLAGCVVQLERQLNQEAQHLTEEGKRCAPAKSPSSSPSWSISLGISVNHLTSS